MASSCVNFANIIGLSFERLYWMEGLNLMIAKSADFSKNHRFWQKTADFEKLQISKTADFRKLKISKTVNFYVKRKTKFA